MMKWKKGMAALMAGIMSFGVLSTTLAVPAEAAASHRNYENPRIEQDRDVHRPQPLRRDRDQERRDRDYRNDRRHTSSGTHSTGEVTTAAVLGAVVGAVIAKNT